MGSPSRSEQRSNWPDPVRIAALEQDADRFDRVHAEDLATLRIELAEFRSELKGVGRVAQGALGALTVAALGIIGNLLVTVAGS